MTQEGKPTSLADVIKRGMRAALDEIHTSIPGKVVRVNKDGDNVTSVDVQPLIKVAYLDESLARQAELLPQINAVPVCWPGAGNYRITFPIAAGDTGKIEFSESSLDVWLTKGGEVDPLDDRRCHLSDAMFSPGLRSFAEPWQSVPSDRMTIGADAGLQIHIDGSKVRIGSNVDLDLGAVAMAEAIKTWIAQAQTAFAGHSHATPAGATTSVVGALPSAPTDLASSTVFAKK